MADRPLKGFLNTVEAARLAASIARIDRIARSDARPRRDDAPPVVAVHVLNWHTEAMGFAIDGVLPADCEAWIVQDGKRVAELHFVEQPPL